MAPLVDNLAIVRDSNGYDHRHHVAVHHHHHDYDSTTTTSCTQKNIPIQQPLSSFITSRPQSQPQGQQRTNRVKKHVTFSTYSEMYFVPHLDDMTHQEYLDTYMTDDDYRRIRQEIKDSKTIMEQYLQTPSSRQRIIKRLGACTVRRTGVGRKGPGAK